jgi:hypothetical protein
MNKDRFIVARDNFNSLAPKIGTTINKLMFNIKSTDSQKFNDMELARNNIGMVCFSDLFSHRRFPDYFYQIGKDGFLNHQEMDRLDSIIPRFMNY